MWVGTSVRYHCQQRSSRLSLFILMQAHHQAVLVKNRSSLGKLCLLQQRWYSCFCPLLSFCQYAVWKTHPVNFENSLCKLWSTSQRSLYPKLLTSGDRTVGELRFQSLFQTVSTGKWDDQESGPGLVRRSGIQKCQSQVLISPATSPG